VTAATLARVVRRALPLLVAVVAAATLAATAAADGDPASDILLTQNYYLPYPEPPKEATAPLKESVAAAFAKGYRVKVAVIATKTDLGTVPSLFNKPSQYAKFLGSEIKMLYVGPLLIVMPEGFGIWDGGRTTAAEERVLDTLSVKDGSPGGLAAAADEAVRKLTSTGALKSKDVLGPTLFPRSALVVPGKPVKLTYAILEDSERSREVVWVYAGKTKLATLHSPLGPALYGKPRTVRWTAPKKLPRGALRYCVRAFDAAGNRSRTACVPLGKKVS
jgi:hypothetical protein